MKDKMYVKAFKALKRKLRDIVHDQKASLYVIVLVDGLVIPAFFANSIYNRFVDACGCLVNDVNNIKLKHMKNGWYSMTSFFAKTGLKHSEFMKLWIRSAIGNDLYITDPYLTSAVKFLDSHDTIESLCVEYDMKSI